MSRAVVYPGRLQGSVVLPCSKSQAHRLLICAALAPGVSRVRNVQMNDDISATLGALSALGAAVQINGEEIIIDGSALFSAPQSRIDCKESGSTLRFLIPIAAAGGISAQFTGSGRLPQRPIGIYLDCLPKAGVRCASQGGLPLKIEGQLRSGVFTLPGNVSSQFITGLLLALPLLPGDSEIRLTTPLESSAYVDMTIDAMASFGVTVRREATGYSVPGNQRYAPRDCTVEGDWSQAAFFLCAGGLGGDLLLRGLRPDSLQGDKAAAELFARFGAQLRWEADGLRVSGGQLQGIEADASQVPDLVPALAATAALAQGVTRITGAARLRLKESDRLAAMAQGLHRLGCRVEELPDGLVIHGTKLLQSGCVNGCNDHRIVMAFAMAALRSGGPVEISDAQSVGKSYPHFFDDFIQLGGNAHVVHMG